MDYAPSTIAMTAYNLLSIFGQPMSRPQLLDSVNRSAQLGEIESADFEAAIDIAVSKSLILESQGALDIADPKRRKVVNRDRSDGEFGEDGNPIGGWKRWTVNCKDRGLILLESALEESA